MSNKIKSAEQAQHTPAPWHLAEYGETPRRHFTICVGSKKIATIQDVPFLSGNDTPEANARLIAAAPDLLSACEGLFDVIESRVRNAEINDWKEKLQAGRDAIRKAKGT